MRLRLTAPAAAFVLAIGTLGCVDRGYDITDLSGKLEVSPPFYGIDEGLPAVQFEATIDGDPVAVTWESSAPTVASVSNTGVVTPLNDGFAAITATLTSNPTVKKSASFTVNELFGTPLVSGVDVTAIGGTEGDQDLIYRVYVPEGSTNVTFTLTGGTGDFDIYIRRGPALPNYDEYDCVSWNGGNEEECSIDDPASGTWYVFIDVYTTGAGATLRAVVTP